MSKVYHNEKGLTNQREDSLKYFNIWYSKGKNKVKYKKR